MPRPTETIKGRGAADNPPGRFETTVRERDEAFDVLPPDLRTEVTMQEARGIISRNDSPDVPFSQSLNPYSGCEHGCVYCYARPTHACLGLSPGIDFETKIFAKTNAVALLRKELSRPGYRCESIALGANTDPYQPVERKLGITRGVLEVMREFRQPCTIVTKSSLVERDLDILVPMARDGLTEVFVSIGVLDPETARTLEPRAAAPHRRLETVRRLNGAGVPCGVLVAPIIPFLNDGDMEAVLEAAAQRGARSAGYVLLRLPHEVSKLFRDWLERHHPLRAEHIMARIRDMRGGRDNDPAFGARMRGRGVFAELIAQRFKKACRRHGIDSSARAARLDTSRFRAPGKAEAERAQLDLFAGDAR